MLGRFGVFDAIFDPRRAGFDDRAKRFDGDVQKAAGLVSGARILIEHRTEFRSVFLVPIDHRVDLSARLGVLRAVRQDMLGAAEFRHLGEQNRAAASHQQVGA